MQTLKDYLIENMSEKKADSFNSDSIDDSKYLIDFTAFIDFSSETNTVNKLFHHIDQAVTKLSNNNHFKIGKTRSVENRMSQYKNPVNNEPAYTKMYLILSSNSSEVIDTIEAQCNTRYINHEKNDNKNEGSAGTCGSHDDKYYLYIVTR